MKTYAIGIDLGGTTIKAGIFKNSGELSIEWELPTRKEENGALILSDIAKSVLDTLQQNAIKKEDVIGLGIGVPGPVNRHGEVSECVNLGWKQIPVTSYLSSRLDIPCLAENDANVAALGEVWKGGGVGYHSMVMVTLGTGVGGGIILHDTIVSGSHCAGGEIGHIKVNLEEQRPCGCGKKGCLEQYASATGIVTLAKAELQKGMDSLLATKENITCKDIFDAAKEKDALATQVVSTVYQYLAHAFATISCICDPEVFVIGGGVSNAGDMLIKGIQQNFQTYCFPSTASTKFVLAKLGNRAGIYGAVKLVFDRYASES